MIRVKHALDRALALVGLVVLSPLLAAVAVWILVTSGRPVLLRQERAGLHGRPFRMLKFRTMVPNAVAAAGELGLEDPYGLVDGDPRITRPGRFLRRTGLDELPQLWNVLRGEMSLVGPRPDLVEQAARYTEEDSRRLAMRPGLTGWSQIQGRAEIPWPVRFRHDAWYVANWSLRLDATILMRTLAHLRGPEERPVDDRMNIERARRAGRGSAVEVPPDEWDGVLAGLGCADAYFLRAYVEASCVLDGGRPTLLRRGDAVFACSVRPIPGSDREDVTTPYGYGGPAGPDAAAFWEPYERWCAERALVSTFLRFHPLLGNQRDVPSTVRLERLADTTAWPLDGTGDLVESMHRHHRRAVRGAARDLTVRGEEAPRDLEPFVALYEETMRRREANEFYLFPPAYWEALGGLRDRLVLFEAVDDEGVVAAILCLATAPWLHYHLGGSAERAGRSRAMHLLLLTAARWGRERGFEALHLGGGVGGGEDSLWQFKRRFAPAGAREMWIGKAVHDARAYAELAGTDEVAGRFPAYRPLSAGVPGLAAR